MPGPCPYEFSLIAAIGAAVSIGLDEVLVQFWADVLEAVANATKDGVIAHHRTLGLQEIPGA